MALGPKLQTKVSTSLSLTAGLRHALEILELSTDDLLSHIQEELESNPFLEGQLPDFYKKPRNNNFDDQYEATLVAEKPALHDYLREQLTYLKLDDHMDAVCTALIEAIGDDGYLSTNLEDIARYEQFSLGDIEAGLLLVQNFEPFGVGARSLQECLTLQVKKLENVPEAFHVLVERLEDVAALQLKKMVRETGHKEEAILEAIAFLRTLDPKPGYAFAKGDNHEVTPELSVVLHNQNLEADFKNIWGENLSCNRDLFQSLKTASLEEGQKTSLKDQYDGAKLLLRSINDRFKTLHKITQFLIGHQRDYFLHGVKALKPLTLREIAEHTGLHESTISRATQGKFIQTPQGVKPFKFFFSSSLEGGRLQKKDHSSTSVRHLLENIIRSEDQEKPFSDDDLVIALKAQGVSIARRTVTKYREALNIPSSHMRRKNYKITRK